MVLHTSSHVQLLLCSTKQKELAFHLNKLRNMQKNATFQMKNVRILRTLIFCVVSKYYLTIDHWHLILQKSYPFSSSCWILMSRSECRRTKWSSSCPSKLSSSSQLPKIHHLLLLNRHQGVGLPEGSNFQSQYLWMCHPWRWTRRLVWVVSIYNLNHLNWKYLTQLNNI